MINMNNLVYLINSPISFFSGKAEGEETTNPPLGMLYLGAVLEEADFEVRFFDVTAQNIKLEQMLSYIERDRPFMVGISSLTPGIRSAVLLAKEIKKRFPEITIAIGGPHFSADPDLIKRFPYFDFGITGEAEITLPEITKKISKGKKIRGVIKGEIVQDLDKLPLPARHLINDHYNGENKRASLISSRGCPFRCLYCSRPVLGRSYRFRSPEKILDEMELLHKDYSGRYIFQDDTFSLNRNNTLEFCKTVKERQLDINWMAMTRANCVDEEMIKKFADIGCSDLFFGVEAGNEWIRNEVIHKNVSNRAIERAVSLCRKYGITSNLFLMLGFPKDTKKTIEDTVRFGRNVKADMIGLHLTLPLPGADLFDISLNDNKIDKDVIDDYIEGKLGEGFRESWPHYIPDGLTERYLQEAKLKAYRQFYLNPGWLFRRVKRNIKSLSCMKEDLNMIKTATQVLTVGKTDRSMS